MDDSETSKDYELSRVIDAHRSDVKSLVATDSDLIISGGRDEMVKVFLERNGNFTENLAIKQQKLAVNAVTFYEDTELGWIIFAGRKDGSIAVYRSGSQAPSRIVHEHKMNVCVLHVDKENKKLLSGSWDNNAIVWPILELVTEKPFQAHCLVGHKMSVWTIVSVASRPDFYLTGSADLTIKFWHNDNELKSFPGHNDVVRSLVVLTSKLFLSAANDSTIRLWDLDAGVCLQKYKSFSGEYIYSMSLLICSEQRLLAVSGETGFLELWSVDKSGLLERKQFIRTPAQSLWSLVFCRNSDIAVGADNGSIYVFTTDSSRKASSNDLDVFQALVAQKIEAVEAALLAQQSETIKIKVSLEDGTPDLELRYKKGSDPFDAAETFIQENNLPVSYLNEIADYIMENIAEARQTVNKKLAAVKPQEKVSVDGKEYDYALDVTIDDGRVLKLAYNVGEDPNWVAQRFVEKHNLPVKFLEKVSMLLRTQIPTTNTADNFSDPYIDGRYVPQSSVANSSTPGVVADPLTGGSAYVAGTGTALTSQSAVFDRKRPRSELIPMNAYVIFGVEHASGKAVVKLRELNEQQSVFKLSGEQLSALEEILTMTSYTACDVHVSALDVGFCWSIDTIIPIMDVFRLGLLNETLNRIFCSMSPGVNESARGPETIHRISNFLISATSDPVRILACRAITNAAFYKWGQEMLIREMRSFILAVASQLSCQKSALQLASSSALANCARMLLQHTESEQITELGPREDVLRAIIQVIEKVESFGDYNQEALIRLLQAIATLMWGDASIIKLAKQRDMKTIATKIKDAVIDEAGKSAARDIVEMIYAG